jgi:hypothetical protein
MDAVRSLPGRALRVEEVLALETSESVEWAAPRVICSDCGLVHGFDVGLSGRVVRLTYESGEWLRSSQEAAENTADGLSG